MENDLHKPILKDLHIRLTNKCNMECNHCYAYTDRYGVEELDFNILQSVIKQAISLGCEEVSLTGGEPLLYSHIKEILDFLLELELEVKIETNGLLLDKLYRDIKEKIKRIKIMVSYDPPGIRGAKQMERVFNNLKLLKDHNIAFSTQTIITKDTRDSLPKLLNDLMVVQAKSTRFFLNYDRINKGNSIEPMNYQTALEIKAEIESYNQSFKVVFPGIFENCTSGNCGWGYERCEIMPNGDVTSCAPMNYYDYSFKAGNIYQTDLDVIWLKSDHFKKIRALEQKEYDFPCNICPEFNLCRGACRAIGYSTYGSIVGTFPYCTELYESIKISYILIKPDSVKHLA
ncbi:MAG: radical SAM protein, partial [Candidatus Heimdallarchaeaceae archaeon]